MALSDQQKNIIKVSILIGVSAIGVALLVTGIVLIVKAYQTTGSDSASTSIASSSTSSSTNSSSSQNLERIQSFGSKLPVHNGVYYIVSENGYFDKFNRLTSKEGYLHISENDNSDANSKWKFTMIKKLSNSKAIYQIENYSKNQEFDAYEIDSSNHDLVSKYKKEQKPSKQWIVELEDEVSEFNHSTLMKIYQNYECLTFGKGMTRVIELKNAKEIENHIECLFSIVPV